MGMQMMNCSSHKQLQIAGQSKATDQLSDSLREMCSIVGCEKEQPPLFVGREQEVKSAKDALTDGRNVLLSGEYKPYRAIQAIQTLACTESLSL